MNNLETFGTRTEELLDIDWVAEVIYGFYAAISLAIFVLTPLSSLFYWTLGIVQALLVDDGTFWSAGYGAFSIFFLFFAHFYVGAYGPGLLRQLLYRVIVQPKLDRIYRENHEEVEGPQQAETRVGFWMRLKEGFYSIRLSLTLRRERYVRLPLDIDEAFDAISLHSVPLNREDVVDTSERDSDEYATEDYQPEEQQDDTLEPLGRARRKGAKFGTWIGSKVGAALSFPLKVAVHLGDLSTELGNKAQAMRYRRLQRERREDLPGDIYLL